jgi:flagellar basal-body rod modification protein FlgD
VADGITIKSSLESDPLTSVQTKYNRNPLDTTKGEDESSYMDFDSYLKVLVAQMSNQDFNNPMSDSEFMAQMASYSQLEAVKNMTLQANISYATGLTGKPVTVNDGNNYDMGLVDSVVIENGKPKLLINGNSYDPSMVTDVVSDNLYAIMESLKGVEVSFETSDESGKGIVTGGLVANGSQFLILDGKDVYPLSAITLPSGDNAEDVVGDAEKNGETEIDPNAPVNTDETDETKVTGETEDDSDDVDAVGGTDSEQLSVGGTEKAAATDDAEINEDSEYAAAENETDVVEVVMQAEKLDAAAGLTADNNVIQSFSATSPRLDAKAAGDVTVQSIPNVDIDTYNQSVGIPTTTQGTLNEATQPTTTGQQVSSVYQPTTSQQTYPTTGSNQYYYPPVDEDFNVSSNYDALSVYGADRLLKPNRGGTVSVASNSPYENTVYVDQNPGTTFRNSPYFRKYADSYPDEAALANAYGTRMYDIRYINNREICDNINRTGVIGTTSSGRQITDLGFSGQGALGEVVTYADGTQRVEIIMDDGGSGWYTTSGRFTINQIVNSPDPNIQRSLNRFELAIKHYGLTRQNNLP